MQTIMQITDLHFDNNDPELKLLDPKDNFNELVKYVQKNPCDKIIVTGDIAEAEENFQTIISRLQGLNENVKHIAGNHDPIVVTQERPYFMEYLEELMVLFLDSSQGIIDCEQLKWLKELLQNNKKDILVFMHHPIMDCGNTVMDRMFPLLNRSEVFSLLQNTGKKVYIFCGHYHWEQEVQSGNIKQYVTPSMLYQLDRNADFLKLGSTSFGFRIIKISKDKVESYVEMLTRNS